MQCFFHLAVRVLILLLPISYGAPHVNDGAEHRQVSRYVACWTGRLCCHSSSVYVIMYLWEVIKYSTTIMARSSQFAWFYCRVLFFSSVSAVCFLPASSQFRLATSVREFPKQLGQVPGAHCLPNLEHNYFPNTQSTWSVTMWSPILSTMHHLSRFDTSATLG